ncbi:MAG: iron-sulfur cluster assembly accessory protein [Cyanobacteria bacterium P01_A01_bin.37]
MNGLPSITFSPAAIKEILRLKSQQSSEDASFLKVELLRGGCMDCYYNLSFSPETPTTLSTSVDDETSQSFQFFIPESSQMLLEGVNIDYSEDLMGGGFRFSNPQANQTCGCGNSFSID